MMEKLLTGRVLVTQEIFVVSPLTRQSKFFESSCDILIHAWNFAPLQSPDRFCLISF